MEEEDPEDLQHIPIQSHLIKSFCSTDKPDVSEILVGLGCMSNGFALCAVVG